MTIIAVTAKVEGDGAVSNKLASFHLGSLSNHSSAELSAVYKPIPEAG